MILYDPLAFQVMNGGSLSRQPYAKRNHPQAG